jgi:23S rRNA pseudouridine2605 synthase
VRINQYLARSGMGSRRRSETLVLNGSVMVNGEVIQNLAYTVKDGDLVTVDGKPCSPAETPRVIMLNKPKSYICTQFDPQERNTVYELLDQEFKNFHYIGRLDLHSRGLLMFGNHGELSRRLCLPEYQIERVYRVKTPYRVSESAIQQIESGLLSLNGVQYKPASIKVYGPEFEICLKEGKKREIREMMQALGYQVLDLKRLSYANLELGNLREGSYRELETDEVQELFKLVQLDWNYSS